jgi:hypothetical protein
VLGISGFVTELKWRLGNRDLHDFMVTKSPKLWNIGNFDDFGDP